MYGFLIKKAFFDMWDNLLATFVLNVGFVVIILGAVHIPLINSFYLSDMMIINYLLLFVDILFRFSIFSIYMGAVSSCAKMITDYERVNIKYFIQSLKETIKPSFLFALVNTVFAFFCYYALSYYYFMESIYGVILFTIVFWVSIIWVCAAQYFFPLQSRIDKIFKKNIKKMFYMLFGNSTFTIILLIISILIIAISIFTFLLIPGITFVMILLNTALKLRLLKYDYLEENTNANPKKIPWDILLEEERKSVGKRTLKGMIFPWKD